MAELIEFKRALNQVQQRYKESRALTREEMILLLLESMVTLRWPGDETFNLNYQPARIDGEIKEILVIQLSAIGDVVLSTPTIRGLREKYPQSKIVYLVEETASEIVLGNPDLDEVILFEKRDYVRELTEGRKSLPRIVNKLKNFIDSLKEKKFEWVLNLNPTPRSAFLTHLIGSRKITGLTVSEAGRPFLSGSIWVLYKYKYFMSAKEFLEEPGRLTLAEINMRMAGVDPSKRELAIFIEEDEWREGERLLEEYGVGENDILIGLNPGSNFETRCWFPDRFARLGDILREYGARIIIFGGPDEGGLIDKIAAMMENEPIIDVPEETALRRLAVLLKRCDHLITNDTGPMHIAAAVGTSVIAICGPTRVGAYGQGHIQIQADLPCIGCSPASSCQTRECMERIEPEVVLAAVRFQRGELSDLPVIPGINIYSSNGLSHGRLFTYLPQGDKVRPEEVINLAGLNLWMEENRKLGYEERPLSLNEMRTALSKRDFDSAYEKALYLVREYRRLCQEGVGLLRDEIYPLSLAVEKEGLKELEWRFNEIEERMNNGIGEFFGFLDHLFLRGQDEIGWRLNLCQAKEEAAGYLCQFLEGKPRI